MIKHVVICAVTCAALSGCATHRIIAADPNPSGEPVTRTSTAYFWGTAQKRTVTCAGTGMDEVQVRQKLGNSLLSIVTLGIVTPIELRYVCRKIEPSSGTTDERPPVAAGGAVR